MSTAAPAPIMLRADISRAEWTALRKLALDKATTTQALVAAALRATYDLAPSTAA